MNYGYGQRRVVCKEQPKSYRIRFLDMEKVIGGSESMRYRHFAVLAHKTTVNSMCSYVHSTNKYERYRPTTIPLG